MEEAGVGNGQSYRDIFEYRNLSIYCRTRSGTPIVMQSMKLLTYNSINLKTFLFLAIRSHFFMQIRQPTFSNNSFMMHFKNSSHSIGQQTTTEKKINTLYCDKLLYGLWLLQIYIVLVIKVARDRDNASGSNTVKFKKFCSIICSKASEPKHYNSVVVPVKAIWVA